MASDALSSRSAVSDVATPAASVTDSHVTGHVCDCSAAAAPADDTRRGRLLAANFRLEPLILVFVFGITLVYASTQNLYMDRVCAVNLRFNSSVCMNITGYPVQQNRVQTVANKLFLYQNLIQNGAGLLMTVVAGPLSDAFGRRPLLLFSIGCSLLSVSVYIVLLLCAWLPAQFLLLSSIPVALSGGSACFMALAFSYTSDVTTVRHRTARFSLVDACFFAPLAVGFILTGYTLPQYGYIKLYFVSLALIAMTFLYGCLCLPESLAVVGSGPQQMAPRDLFVRANPARFWRIAVMPRAGHNRSVLLLACLAFVIQQMSFSGESAVTLQFVSKMFRWNFTAYTVYSAFVLAVCILFNVLVAPTLSVWLGVSDGVIGCGATLCRLASLLTRYQLATSSTAFYLTSLIGLPGVLIVTALRAIISKAVSAHEIGAVYACLSAVESVCNMTTSSLFLLLYNHLLVLDAPSLVYLVTAALVLPLLLLFIIILMRQRNGHFVYAHLENCDVISDQETLTEGSST